MTRRVNRVVYSIFYLLGCISSSHAIADEPQADTFTSEVVPYLQRYCFECHSDGKPEAGVAFDRFENSNDAIASGELWLKTLDALEGHLMPPDEATQPTHDETQSVIDWIETDFIAQQSSLNSTTPSVVVRRLNHQEYNNTLRDLLGINLDLARDFPPDEIGYGYDNIGSALNISPIHVEKYIQAAEQAMSAAMRVPNVEGLSPRELIGLRTYPLPADEAVSFEHTLSPGLYLAEFSLVRVGVPESVPTPILEINFGTDRRKLRSVRIQDETAIYRYWLNVVEGDNKVTVSVASESRNDENFNRPKNVEANVSGDQRYGGNVGLHVDSMVVRGPALFPPAERNSFEAEYFPASPDLNDTARRESAQNALTRFAKRAYRRPLEESELTRLMSLYDLAADRGESYQRAVQMAMTAALVSPQFLFLVEPVEASRSPQLNEYELASRLSYFLWSSMPDDELLTLADRGTLRSQLRLQVQRMLASPKSRALVENFCGQWLQLRRLSEVNPDTAKFPGFDPDLRQSMVAETEHYFDYILRNNRSILELINSDYSFVNQRLAEHYGLGGIEGPEFRHVVIPDGKRGGVLTQASILTLTSNPNRTSPVKRGKWVLQQILGTPPPPPPPTVEKLEEKNDGQAEASLRERLMKHRENPACASCHNQMDPIGFALENYDAIGRWRQNDDQFPVDASGELAGGLLFDDITEFKRILETTGKKRVSRSFIENLLTYSLGRGLEPNDIGLVESIRKQLEQDEYKVQSVIFGIVESQAFQERGQVLTAP